MNWGVVKVQPTFLQRAGFWESIPGHVDMLDWKLVESPVDGWVGPVSLAVNSQGRDDCRMNIRGS